jgi:hypothetical protein
MESEEKKYRKILNILKKSKPVLQNTSDLEENVINMILQKQKTKDRPFNILDVIFGWVYVRWVRTVLVTTSVLLILVFVYQQTIILKRINNLDSRAIFLENQMVSGEENDGDRTLLYRLSGRILPAKGITISEKQFDQIINSYNELEGKYKNLIKLIEEDPELKKYVEEKLNEKNKKKLNL